MKKVGIVTIIDNNNYGNRLQNYAVQESLKKLNKYEVETIKNEPRLNSKISKFKYFLKWIKSILIKVKNIINNSLRKKRFLEFNKENIKFSRRTFNVFNKYTEYEYFVVGSDQVWNPLFSRLRDFELLNFDTTAKKVSFSASFGISELPNEYKENARKGLLDFNNISVREDAGKEIIKNLGVDKEVEVLVDPTMLLTTEEWDKISKKPVQLKNKKYILNYFLGELSKERKQKIDSIAQENDCEIIDILNPNSPFYQTGPSEFLYLEKNAFAIFTDSFHSCVFAILYNVPFLVFDREDKNEKMNSRIDTLLKKFELEDRRYLGEITYKNLQINYSKAHKKIEEEKQKTMNFFRKSFE